MKSIHTYFNLLKGGCTCEHALHSHFTSFVVEVLVGDWTISACSANNFFASGSHSLANETGRAAWVLTPMSSAPSLRLCNTQSGAASSTEFLKTRTTDWGFVFVAAAVDDGALGDIAVLLLLLGAVEAVVVVLGETSSKLFR
jgi:hypothetical protein